MATAKPAAVMTKASPTGPATRSKVICPASAMPLKALKMPQTVPNRPTKGEMAPTVANSNWPQCNRLTVLCMLLRKTRVSWCSRSPAAAKVPPKGSKVASNMGVTD